MSVKLVGHNDNTPEGYDIANISLFTKYVAVASGNMIEFGIRCQNNGNVKYAIYSDNAGVPYQKLASGVSAVTASYNVLTIDSVSIVNGTTYWLAVIADTNNTGYYASAGSVTLYLVTNYAAFSYPATFDNSGYGSQEYLRNVAGWGNLLAVGRSQGLII